MTAVKPNSQKDNVNITPRKINSDFSKLIAGNINGKTMEPKATKPKLDNTPETNLICSEENDSFINIMITKKINACQDFVRHLLAGGRIFVN